MKVALVNPVSSGNSLISAFEDFDVEYSRFPAMAFHFPMEHPINTVPSTKP